VSQPPGRAPLRLFYLGDAALARESLGRPGGAIEVIEALPPAGTTFHHAPVDLPPGATCPFDLLVIEHGHPGVDTLAILQDVVGRALHVPVVVVADWDDELAVQALKLLVVILAFHPLRAWLHSAVPPLPR